MLTITYIPIFNDNYIWVIFNPENHQCAIVDPGDAQPVLDFLKNEDLDLHAILITHHHWDHVGGVDEILKDYSEVPVYAPKKCKLNCHTIGLSEGDIVELPPLDLGLQIIETPGHTLDHIAYYSPPHLFCGDTLFSAGCGRLFEGTPRQLYHSLQKLAVLPDDTKVYCTHEYTLKNLQFALTVEPDNLATQHYLKTCQALRHQDLPTLPSSIGNEKQINPFMRCNQPEIISKLNDKLDEAIKEPEQIFAILRQQKDVFY